MTLDGRYVRHPHSLDNIFVGAEMDIHPVVFTRLRGRLGELSNTNTIDALPAMLRLNVLKMPHVAICMTGQNMQQYSR